MGLFGKIKNILFEDDSDVEMPVYTKEEVEEEAKEEVHEVLPEPIKEEPIVATPNSHFRNVKRDIDISFDEKDVLGEIPGALEAVKASREEEEELEKRVNPEPAPEPEKKSPFLSFDEDEFERLNSRINRNEQRVRREVKSVATPISAARKANNNFSSTTTSHENKNAMNPDRYKINSGTLGNGKKPFTPSPVISPVYGILDKNYKKDDIVDRQGGMKREKVIKPIISHKPEVKPEVKVDVKPKVEVNNKLTNEVELPKVSKEIKSVKTVGIPDLDFVRKKAYGTLTSEDIEKAKELNIVSEVKEEVKTPTPVTPKPLDLDDILNHNMTRTYDDAPKIDKNTTTIEEAYEVHEHVAESVRPNNIILPSADELDDPFALISNSLKDDPEEVVKDTPSVEDQLDEKFEVPTEEISKINEELEHDKIEDNHSPHLLDDLEKTSTLQILDDIEKELNAIKPISSRNDDNIEDKQDIDKDDTLEKDLFNLIDSMYEEGEEEEDD